MFSQLSTSSVVGSTDSGSTSEKSLKTVSYRVYPSKELEKIWKKWVSAVRKVYNISIEQLNRNQGYTKVGKKGGKHGFRTWLKQSGLIPQWCRDLNVSKILDNASMEAYTAWKETAKQPKSVGKGKNLLPNPQAGLKIAKFRSVRDHHLTIQFDPTAYKAGRWMVSTTKHLPKPEFKGQDFCVLTDGSTELTYNKGRWFAHFPVEFDIEPTETKKVIALDPGVRTFMTGFDGTDFLEFANNDFQRIAKLCSHLDKLKSEHDKSKGRTHKRRRYKLRIAMERLRTKIRSLRTELHKQVASFLARNYDVIVLPTFETSQMVVKKKRKLKSKTARAMMTWAFYQFSQILEHLCNRYGSKLVRITEEYTSKTCTKCGHIHRKLGSSMNFQCPRCGYEIPRDFNGAVGIFLKAMWDTTFLEAVGDVVLSFSDSNDILDIQDVGICPG
ncbi:transposase [Moorena producens JHB]|uniref:Transposase n=1 Tax=Moorena producens (strain JHB) TaxID=1454205 RepID=A0A1D9GBA1_MOOP1|nr:MULTISPECIES: transposase [Moorena]AOY84883.2 transposase [Moorena producens JHB]